MPCIMCFWVIGSSMAWDADFRDVEKVLGVPVQTQEGVPVFSFLRNDRQYGAQYLGRLCGHG